MLRFSRCFSCRSPALNAAKTYINPASYTLQKPALGESGCGFIFATPSMLPSIISQCEKFHTQFPDTQLVVAGVDTLVNSERSGVSELWLADPVNVDAYKVIDSGDAPLRESDGINIVTAKDNWKLTSSSIHIKIGNQVNTTVNLANTLFSTGFSSTLFVLEHNKPYSGEALETVSISVDSASATVTSTSDIWTPLYETEEKFIVTKCIGNLVKEINGKSASGYLQDNAKLMSIASKETKVYVKLYKQGQTENEKPRFEVIAGGGGWGAKASTIVVSPEAVVAEGDLVEFFMVTPHDRFAGPSPASPDSHTGTEGIVGRFECSYEPTTYSSVHASSAYQSTVVADVFCVGSDSGFCVNGIQHFSVGERVSVLLSSGAEKSPLL